MVRAGDIQPAARVEGRSALNAPRCHVEQASLPLRGDPMHLAQRVANTNVAVLIRGESGTGKELFAEAIHNESSRKGKPFVVINCGAIPAALFESELFGYQPGAFTGADRKGRPGKFEIAHQGTIFLDEIGEMPLDLQVKLLRVLQSKRFYKVGGNDPIEVDVRVIAATHRDLEQMIADGLFREDLYYRLNVIPIDLPPLRSRKEDIMLLADTFIKKYNAVNGKNIQGIADDVKQLFLEYDWPGNVRELENVIEYGISFEKEDKISKKTLAHRFNPKPKSLDCGNKESLSTMLEEYERQILTYYLNKYGDSLEAKYRMAEELKISKSTLYRKLNNLKLNSPRQ